VAMGGVAETLARVAIFCEFLDGRGCEVG
jgi:hypothetical protein